MEWSGLTFDFAIPSIRWEVGGVAGEFGWEKIKEEKIGDAI